MRLWQKYLDIVSVIVPAGAVGASLLLGSTVPSAAAERPVGLRPKLLRLGDGRRDRFWSLLVKCPLVGSQPLRVGRA